MTVTTLTSREFSQDTGRARKAAESGPLFITDGGRPTHVLLTMADYQKLASVSGSIVALLAMPDVADIDFMPPRLPGPLARPADLS